MYGTLAIPPTMLMCSRRLLQGTESRDKTHVFPCFASLIASRTDIVTSNQEAATSVNNTIRGLRVRDG